VSRKHPICAPFSDDTGYPSRHDSSTLWAIAPVCGPSTVAGLGINPAPAMSLTRDRPSGRPVSLGISSDVIVAAKSSSWRVLVVGDPHVERLEYLGKLLVCRLLDGQARRRASTRFRRDDGPPGASPRARRARPRLRPFACSARRCVRWRERRPDGQGRRRSSSRSVCARSERLTLLSSASRREASTACSSTSRRSRR
jgi:hypothetical protein